MYLETIFSAPDIQRQLPAEAKMFVTVDKSYKEIMRKVNKVPLAIRAATQPGDVIRYLVTVDTVSAASNCYLRRLLASEVIVSLAHANRLPLPRL